MSFSYISPENLKSNYEQAVSAMSNFFADFPEYERIANAEPKNVKPGNPEVTDATTASFIETRPKAIVQKSPTGRVVLKEDNEELSDLLGEMVENVILPNATTGGSVKTKSLTSLKNALIYGSQPALCFIRNEEHYFGADFALIDIRDVFLEPGKTHISDCNWVFMNAWYTKSDIESIIYSEKELGKDKDYKTTWNLKKIEELKEKTTSKDTDKISTTPNEFIKLVCAFQKGKNGIFYTFDPDTGEIVRKWRNLDPRGKIPIIYLYREQDGKNPLGLSAIRLTRRLQDMLDTHHQNYQFQIGMKSAPITKIKGSSIDTDSIVYEPYAVWDLGSDPNAEATTVQTDNTLINTFPTVQGILKSNILNITNNGDTSISAEVGDPGFSKTPAGVTAQQQRIDTADNYLRGQFEEWFGEVLETMLNLHIAAHFQAEEDQVVPLSQRFLENKRKTTPGYEMKKAKIEWEKLEGVLANFEIDASSSKIDNDKEQLETLNHLLELRLQAGAEMEKYLKIAPLIYQIVKRSGVPNAEEIAPKTTEEEDSLASTMNLIEPQSPTQLTNLPTPVNQLPPKSEEDDSLINQLVSNGLSPEQAVEVSKLIASGVDPAEIDKRLKEAK